MDTTADDADLLPRVIATAGEAEVRLGAMLGLSAREVSVIGFLVWGGAPIGARDLRRRFGLSAAAATELLDRLEAAGHVRRTPWPADRRVVHVTVTPATADAIADRLAPVIDGMRRIYAEMSPKQLRTVRAFLGEVLVLHRDFTADRTTGLIPQRGTIVKNPTGHGASADV